MAGFAINYLPFPVLGKNSPTNKLNIAAIGINGAGKRNLSNCENENIVALCDVDLNLSSEMFKKYPKAKVYQDYRVMLEKQKDIDCYNCYS